jgi:hypothetical protein
MLGPLGRILCPPDKGQVEGEAGRAPKARKRELNGKKKKPHTQRMVSSSSRPPSNPHDSKFYNIKFKDKILL